MEKRRMFTIEQARKYAGMTQKEMAKRIGTSTSTYVRIEQNVSNARVGTINRISQCTGIPVSDFILQ